MRIASHSLFIVCQVGEKSEALDAICGDSLTVNHDGTIEELAEVVPVEVPAVLELLHQTSGIESIPRLPELQHHKPADEGLIERPRGEHAEIVDVACFVPLITGTDFLRKHLGKRKADNVCRCKRQEPEITLEYLRPLLRRQGRCLAPADVQLDLAHAARVPLMGISGIDSPRQTILRLVVSLVRNGQLNAVKRL